MVHHQTSVDHQDPMMYDLLICHYVPHERKIKKDHVTMFQAPKHWSTAST